MLKKIYHSLQTTKKLGENGKLHKQILLRLFIMLGMTAFAFGVVAFDIIIGRLHIVISIAFIFITFVLGFLMSSTNKIIWDEKQELFVAKKMDLTSVIVLVTYMAARLGSKYLLNSIYHNTTVVFAITMSIIAGLSLGRLLGLTFMVRKTYLIKNNLG